MKVLHQLRQFFSPNPSSSVVVRSKDEDNIIERSQKEVEAHLNKVVESSDSFSVFAQKELGVIEIVKKNCAQLGQIFDGFYLRATNQKDDSQEEFETGNSLKEKNALYDEARVNYSIEDNSIKKRKSIRTYRHKERLGILKHQRAYLDESLGSLTQQLDKGVDLRTVKHFMFQRVLIVLGIIIASTAEAGNAMNSLMVLRADPLLELFTTCGIALGLIVTSKAIVYCFSNGNLLLKAKDSGSEENQNHPLNAFDFGGILVLTVSLCFVYYLAELRIEFMIQSDQNPTKPVKLFLQLCGVLLFASTVLLAMFQSNPKGKLKALYSKVYFQLKRIDKRIHRLQAKLSRIRSRYEADESRNKNNLQSDRAYVFNDRPRELKEKLLADTDEQNSVLVMSRQSKLELIHGAQALIQIARGLMEQKLGEQHSWQSIDLTDILQEPNYQILSHKSPIMKNNFSILRPAFVILGLLGLFSCGSNSVEPEHTEIITIVDETAWNPLQSEITADDVFKLGHVTDNESRNSIDFTAYTLNDISLNRTYSASLKASDDFMTNTFTRQEEIEAFSEEISGIFEQVYTIQPETFEFTQLWVPLAKIIDLHKEIEGQKVILIQSDMLENGHLISFYELSGSLEKNPEKIREYLDDLYPLEDLYDFEIVILYQPDRMNDRMFRSAANVFAGLLRDKGATVSVKATL